MSNAAVGPHRRVGERPELESLAEVCEGQRSKVQEPGGRPDLRSKKTQE